MSLQAGRGDGSMARLPYVSLSGAKRRACPKCGAKPGESCQKFKDGGWYRMPGTHGQRRLSCQKCGARPGEMCVDESGERMETMHRRRNSRRPE